MAGKEVPEIETGENKIEVTVNISYEIRYLTLFDKVIHSSHSYLSGITFSKL